MVKSPANGLTRVILDDGVSYEFPAPGCFWTGVLGCVFYPLGLFFIGFFLVLPGSLLLGPGLAQALDADTLKIGLGVLGVVGLLIYTINLFGRVSATARRRNRIELTSTRVAVLGVDAYSKNPFHIFSARTRELPRSEVQGFALKRIRRRRGIAVDHLVAVRKNGSVYMLYPCPWTTPTLAQDLCDDLNEDLQWP